MLLFFLILLTPLDSLYIRGNYLAVIEKGDRLLKDTTLSVEEKVHIHKKLAFSYVIIGSERLAKLEFLEALFLNHELRLDPRLTPPKIMEVFREAKRSFTLPPLEAVRPKRDLPALLIPGIIQRREGRTRPGNTLLLSGVLSLGGIIGSHYMCERTHNRYLNAKEEDEIERRYNEYRAWYNVRGFFITTGTVTYLIHLISLATD